ERYFDITAEGNFEGSNILHRTIDTAEAARLFGRPETEVGKAIGELRTKLFAAREKRIKPGRDDKILAAWNALMIGAFAEGYRALGDVRYLETARRAAQFALDKLWDGTRLHRSFNGGVARFNAYLEDYALMTSAMIDMYEASIDSRWLDAAGMFAGVTLEHFLDRERGGFFFTSDDHETLITRSKPSFDGSTPSGNSAMVMALLRLHSYTGEARYLAEAQRTIRLFTDSIEKQPFVFAHMLEGIDLYQRGAVEIVLGGGNEGGYREWLAKIGAQYVPNRAIYVPDLSSRAFLPEIARDRPAVSGMLTAYVCRERACSVPITSLDGLMTELRD
ncbi:MAG: thioredoxin domain-containing protein, partial [Candidatus Binataceae bacterium]